MTHDQSRGRWLKVFDGPYLTPTFTLFRLRIDNEDLGFGASNRGPHKIGL